MAETLLRGWRVELQRHIIVVVTECARVKFNMACWCLRVMAALLCLLCACALYSPPVCTPIHHVTQHSTHTIGARFPCDLCHEEAVQDGHDCSWATRMVCGFCSREQPLGPVCKHCGKKLATSAKQPSGRNTRHWEGGSGYVAARVCVYRVRYVMHAMGVEEQGVYLCSPKGCHASSDHQLRHL